MTRTILGCAVVVMLAGAAAADEPSLVLRAKELAGLLDDLHTLAKRAGRDEQAARLKTLLQTQPGKGLKGLDPGKPFGLTVELKARLPESRVWLLLPITDEKTHAQWIFPIVVTNFDETIDRIRSLGGDVMITPGGAYAHDPQGAAFAITER